MNRQTRLILVLALLVVVLTAWYFLYSGVFRPEPTVGFLQDDPCVIPCWENITPGRVSELDTLKILIERKLISGDSINYAKVNWLYFLTPEEDEVSIFFFDEYVQRIVFNPNMLLSLRVIIEKWGEPEKIYMGTEGEDHILCHVAFLFYPQYGLRVETAACEDFTRISRLENGNVMPDTLIITLSFVAVAENSFAMLESFDLSEEETRIIEEGMVEWNGYGYYSP